MSRWKFFFIFLNLSIALCFFQSALFADKEKNCQQVLNSKDLDRGTGTGSKGNPYTLSHDAENCSILRYLYKGEGKYKHFRVIGLRAKQLYRFKIKSQGAKGAIRLKSLPGMSLFGFSAKNLQMNLKGNFNLSFRTNQDRSFEFEMMLRKGSECLFILEAVSAAEQAAIEKRKKKESLKREKRREERAKERAKRRKERERMRKERRERLEKRRLERKKRRQFYKVDET